jgi:hypothetical protein
LSTDGVLAFDASGRTLVVDERGWLAVGPTVAERVKAEDEKLAAAWVRLAAE